MTVDPIAWRIFLAGWWNWYGARVTFAGELLDLHERGILKIPDDVFAGMPALQDNVLGAVRSALAASRIADRLRPLLALADDFAVTEEMAR